jgi:hypothetical protein
MADNEQIEGAAISNGESTDDFDSLKARYADLEKKYVTLVNEKKKFAEDKKKLTENLKRWSGLEEEYGVEPEQLKSMLANQADADLQKAR